MMGNSLQVFDRECYQRLCMKNRSRFLSLHTHTHVHVHAYMYRTDVSNTTIDRFIRISKWNILYVCVFLVSQEFT